MTGSLNTFVQSANVSCRRWRKIVFRIHIEEEEIPDEHNGQQHRQESEGDGQGGAGRVKRKRQQSEDECEEQKDASGKRRCLQVSEQGQEITSDSESDEENHLCRSIQRFVATCTVVA